MVRVDMHLADKAEWVKAYDPRDATLFVPQANPPQIGTQIRVDLIVGHSGPKVIFRGKVIARRTRGDGELPVGVSMALGPDEREKVNYLNGFVRGGLLDLRERRRLPLRLAVTYGAIEGPRNTYTRDINEDGVFVVSEDPLPEQSELNLLITFPGVSTPLSLTGIVSHTVVVEDEDVPGMGIRFKFSGDEETRLCKLIDSLETRFLSNTLPDACLL